MELICNVSFCVQACRFNRGAVPLCGDLQCSSADTCNPVGLFWTLMSTKKGTAPPPPQRIQGGCNLSAAARRGQLSLLALTAPTAACDGGRCEESESGTATGKPWDAAFGRDGEGGCACLRLLGLNRGGRAFLREQRPQSKERFRV